MKSKSVFMLLLLLLSLLSVSFIMEMPEIVKHSHANGDGDHTITISVVEGTLTYDTQDDDIQLEPNTNYTIIFKNPDPLAAHNLVIDISDNVADTGGTVDVEDIVIGPQDTNSSATGGEGVEWIGYWKTPDFDTEKTYYCSFSGHYSAGMYGTFVIGEGSSNSFLPGFGIISVLMSMGTLSLIVISRRRK